MLKTVLRYGCRLRPVLNARLSAPLGHRMHTLAVTNQLHAAVIDNKQMLKTLNSNIFN